MNGKRTIVCWVFLISFFSYPINVLSASATTVEPLSSNISIQVDTSAFGGFTNVDTTATRVMATGLVTINLQATGLNDYNAASLRVYTDNMIDSGVSERGMVGQTDPSDKIALKVWTPNYGLGEDQNGDKVPDIENDRNWKDSTNAVWSYILDKNSPASEAIDPWNRTLFNYTDLFKWSSVHTDSNFHLPSSGQLALSQPVRFALALATEASPQFYSTRVYFEFAVSTDLGDTYTPFTTSMNVNVAVGATEPIVTLEVDDSEFNGFTDVGHWPQRELASGPIWISASANDLHPYDAATIRVYTKNAPDDPETIRMGLVGNLDPDMTIPIKVWTPNLGTGEDENGDEIPDITSESNWSDNEKAVWVPAFDYNQPITETWWSELPRENPLFDPNCAWCVSLFNYTDLFKWSDYNDRVDEHGDFVYHLPNNLELIDLHPQRADSRIPLYIAGDFTDALPQTYSTTLYIEFAFSDDKGQTISQSQIGSVDLSVTIPGDRSPIHWLLNRVEMRPDMDPSTETIEKLADSNQEALDENDSGWLYDQALLIMALTAAGYDEQAKHILNGLRYLQNDDGSWFFSYMTSVTEQTIQEWVETNEITLYDGGKCLSEPIPKSNNYPDELEERACWDVTHDLFQREEQVDQIGPWILGVYTESLSAQTETLLPDKIKYRTTDFRKFMGSNAWVLMAINFYQLQTGDDSYHDMALKNLGWIESHLDTDPNSPTFGGIAMGRVWHWWRVPESVSTTYGFTNWPIYVTEHNLDAMAAYEGMAQITGEEIYFSKAQGIKDFMLRELWAPNIDLSLHTEVDEREIDNVFLPGINMEEKLKPTGSITTCVFLDGQSWAVLAMGPDTKVQTTEQVTTTLDIAMDYIFQTMLVTDSQIFTNTGYMVSGIDGFKENDGKPHCESNVEHDEEHLVWSEGSEGVVSALYAIGDDERAGYYHAETASYMMPNGGVPYTNLPADPSDLFWNWTDTSSIAGTAWYYFNELSDKLNPFRYWEYKVDASLPISISISPFNDKEPKIVRFGQNLYVVWDSNSSIFLSISIDGGIKWSTPRPFDGSQPALAVDLNGTLHLVYQEGNDIYYTTSSDQGASFDESLQLGLGRAPDISIDEQGNPHVVWQNKDDDPGEHTEILYSRIVREGDELTHTSPVEVGTTTVGWSEPPQIAVSPSGQNIYVVWKAPPAYPKWVYTHFARSIDSGKTFEAQFNPTGFTSHGEYTPNIAAYGEDRIYITWVLDKFRNRLTRFALSEDSGASFSSPNVLGASNSDRDTTVAISPTGDSCVVWAADGQLLTRCSVDGGFHFSPNQVLAESMEATSPHMPDVLLYRQQGMLKLDIVWEERNKESKSGDIYFVSRQIAPDDSAEEENAPATITIEVGAQPGSRRNFRFSGSLGEFKLDDPTPDDGDSIERSKTFEVEPGTYDISELVPGRWLLRDIICTKGDNLVDRDTGTVSLTVKNGESITCAFYNERLGKIRTRVYEDMDGDSQRNHEPGIADWTVSLYDENDEPISRYVTNRHGKANFNQMLPGSYTACITMQDGWHNTDPGAFAHQFQSKPCISFTMEAREIVILFFGNQIIFETATQNMPGYPLTIERLLDPFDEPDDEEYEGPARDETGEILDPDRDEPIDPPAIIYVPLIQR